MDDPFELALALSHPRQISNHLHDPFAVEPWEKTTLQAEQVPRTYKTFYQAISQPIPRAAYSTQRVFSFSKQQEFMRQSQRIGRNQLPDKKCMGNVSQKSAVTPYNITGNFLTEPAPKRSFNNQFFLRSKDKKCRSKAERGRPAESPISSLSEIKKRFSFQKQSSFQENLQFVRVNNEKQDVRQKIATCATGGRQKRKSKLISIGFRKISVIRSMLKQKSVNLEPLPF